MYKVGQTFTSLLAILLLSSTAAFADAIPVELQQTERGWQLLRGGQPYFIRGAGGDSSLEQLAAAGANSIRTWGAKDIGARLDAAHALGLSVTVGIWLGHERHGFDYTDKIQVQEQLEQARQAVLRYKDHPAVLMWGIGNEMEGFGAGDNPAIWAAVNEIAAMVKQLDPAHPTMTVTAEIGGGRLKYVQKLSPAIDIHGINSYGGAPSLAKRYVDGGGTKPYVLTEFGPPGPWEAHKNSWGAALEPTSTEKASLYRQHYQLAVADVPELALGAYAFHWGHKMEATATWFGMFLSDGSRLAVVDTMTEIWSGTLPINRSPSVSPVLIEGPQEVKPGAVVKASARLKDPEEGTITARWVLRPESADYVTGGDFRPRLADIKNAVIEQSIESATVQMPKEPGPYRLFLYAHDDAGNAATANIPLRVSGKVRTRFPVSVYENGFEGMPWAPSGWMGSIDYLTLDGAHMEHRYAGTAAIRLRFEGRVGWVAVAWQNPPNNWGDLQGGFDLTGATALELWARGEYGGEKIDIGVGLLGNDTANPDSGKTIVKGLFLEREWQRYRIPLKKINLSSIKTGFVVTLKGRASPVTVYMDSIRYIRASDN